MTRIELRSSLSLSGLLFLGCLGCGPEPFEATRWTRLADGFRPAAVLADDATPDPEVWPIAPACFRPGPSLGIATVHVRLARTNWTHHADGLWSAPRVVPLMQDRKAARRFVQTLRLPDRKATRMRNARLVGGLSKLRLDAPEGQLARELENTERPAFLAAGARVYLLLDSGLEAPPFADFTEEISLGHRVEGTWRLELPGVTADGIPVLPGTHEDFELDLPADSTLHFRSVVLGTNGTTVRFRVLWDGQAIFEEERSAGEARRYLDHAAVMPAAGGRGTLTLEVLGDACMTAFLLPVVGPSEVGSPADRPWRAAPDIQLLLADTFRADNLAAWGGDPDLAPELNALADRSRRFLATRAPATWTLASHASFFSGLYPRQSGVLAVGDRLHASALTLAEHLRAAGYRTLAITDGGFVSQTFGLDQGFEWFEEDSERNLEPTFAALERELARDDGRPWFLFIQSYRAHSPYRVSPETRERLGDRYDFALEPGIALDNEIKAFVLESPRGVPLEGLDLLPGLRSIYRGASADTSRGFGHLLAMLEEQGRLEVGFAVFTSDHGEEFGEHGVVGHGLGVWDAQALVPLTIAGPNILPGDDRSVASLVDLPRTLCALAGVAPYPEWMGRDLFGPGAQSPTVFSFQGYRGEHQDLAVVREHWKLIFEDRVGPGDLRHAYDLQADPAEVSDLVGSETALRLAEQLIGPARAVSRGLLQGEAAEVSPQQQAELEALGYGGDADDER